MATKSYTDISQSKKLAEILPLETSDMIYTMVNGYHTPFVRIEEVNELDEDDILCWSLAALLNYLREIDFFPDIEADEHGVKMNINYYDEEEGNLLHPVHEIKVKADDFIDACYELILKLHKRKML